MWQMKWNTTNKICTTSVLLGRPVGSLLNYFVFLTQPPPVQRSWGRAVPRQPQQPVETGGESSVLTWIYGQPPTCFSHLAPLTLRRSDHRGNRWENQTAHWRVWVKLRNAEQKLQREIFPRTIAVWFHRFVSLQWQQQGHAVLLLFIPVVWTWEIIPLESHSIIIIFLLPHVWTLSDPQTHRHERLNT